MEAFWEWFRWLYDETGINFSVLYDPYNREKFAAAMFVTVQIAVYVLFITTLIGLFGVWMQRSRFRLLRWFIRGYIELFRNTPKLVQLYCLYFGVSAFLPRFDDGTGLMAPLIGAFTWVILTFALHYGAFTVEVFRSGIEAVPETTLEAARALGMTKLQVYRLVLLPLAFRICLPALNNNYVFVVKGTSLAYAVGINEMLYAANQIYTLDANVPEMMSVLLICYVSMVTIFVTFMNKLERALKMPGYGT